MALNQSLIYNGPSLGWLPGNPQVQPLPMIFADLPPTPQEGMVASITDSPINTWGVPVTTGGGAFSVALYFQGKTWTVWAK